MTLDQGELHTETFSNSRGWTTIRVTHVPSSTSVERSRTGDLQSAVQAQRECIEEIERRLAPGAGREPATPGPAEGDERAVTREEFDALVARVAALERGIATQGRSDAPEDGAPRPADP